MKTAGSDDGMAEDRLRRQVVVHAAAALGAPELGPLRASPVRLSTGLGSLVKWQ